MMSEIGIAVDVSAGGCAGNLEMNSSLMVNGKFWSKEKRFSTYFVYVNVIQPPSSPKWYHPVGLVDKASASRAEDPGFESHLRRDFSGVESYQ